MLLDELEDSGAGAAFELLGGTVVVIAGGGTTTMTFVVGGFVAGGLVAGGFVAGVLVDGGLVAGGFVGGDVRGGFVGRSVRGGFVGRSVRGGDVSGALVSAVGASPALVVELGRLMVGREPEEPFEPHAVSSAILRTRRMIRSRTTTSLTRVAPRRPVRETCVQNSA